MIRVILPYHLRMLAHVGAEVTLADGTRIFDGMLEAGQHREFFARNLIDIVSADGSTVRLTLNGTSLGVAGPSGAVFHARYGPHGLVNGA